MACTDRQLQQSQITQGFSTRAGVQQAIRPFTGEPSGSNLMDYLNRELFPVVKALRSKVNEVYLPAKENASSANPLYYYFSESTVNADPTLGRIRLNQAVQNTATVIRVSETNFRRQNVATWLSVMQGGSTTPLGVVTLSDSQDPGRFVRFNMSALVDNGSYWDLTVTPVESSHPNPFVEGEPVLVSYIAGVASGGVSLATNVAAIRGVSAGTQLLTSGTLSFANSNNLSWGLNNGTITGSYALNVSAGASSAGVSALVFANDQNVSWGLSNGTITANASQRYFGLPGAVDGAAFSFVNVANLSWSVSSFTFANGGKTQTGAQYTPTLGAALTADSQIGLVSHIGGNSVGSVTRLAFSDVSNVTWSISTAANAATVIASVNAGGGGGMGISAGTQSVSTGTMVFSNSNRFSFGMSGSSRITGSFGLLVSAGTTSNEVNAIVFANGSGVTFGANAGQITASVDPQIGLLSHIGGNSVANATRLAFSNANNFSFSLSTAAGGATLLGSVITSAQQTFIGGIAGGTQTATSGTIVFSNSNDFTFGLSGSTRMTASYLPQIGLVSHIGGNQVSSVTRLAFSNASNVTFSLSTAANAATLLASVNAAAAGGMAIAASGSTQSDSTVNFARPTALDGGMASATLGNVAFAFDTGANSTIVRATALMRITANLTTSGGFPVSKLEFRDGGGIQWGVATSNDAEGRGVQVTAKLADISHWNNFMLGGNGLSFTVLALNLHVFPLQNAGNWAFPGNLTLSTLGLMCLGPGATTTNAPFTITYRGGLYTLVNSTQISLLNSFSITTAGASVTGTGGTTAHNASWSGQRYLTVHSSQWSSQPVLSAGVQYQMAVVSSINATSLSNRAISGAYQFVGLQPDFRGIMGVTQTNSALVRAFPMFGGATTTGIPVSIAQSHLTGSALSEFYRSYVPAMAMAGGLQIVAS